MSSPATASFIAPGEFLRGLPAQARCPGREHRGLRASGLCAVPLAVSRVLQIPREALAAAYGLDVRKRWLFVPENYRWAFARGKIDFFVGIGGDRDELVELVEFSIPSLKQLLIGCLGASRLDGVEVVFRPRPANSTERIRSFFREHVGEDFGAIHVIKEGASANGSWRAISSSSYSTSLIEAAIASRPAYMFEPIPMPAGLILQLVRLRAAHSVGRRTRLPVCRPRTRTALRGARVVGDGEPPARRRPDPEARRRPRGTLLGRRPAPRTRRAFLATVHPQVLQRGDARDGCAVCRRSAAARAAFLVRHRAGGHAARRHHDEFHDDPAAQDHGPGRPAVHRRATAGRRSQRPDRTHLQRGCGTVVVGGDHPEGRAGGRARPVAACAGRAEAGAAGGRYKVGSERGARARSRCRAALAVPGARRRGRRSPLSVVPLLEISSGSCGTCVPCCVRG